MPSILEGRCNACGDVGPRFADGFRSVLLEDGSEAVLPHPGEGGTLAELGLTWDEAKRRGALRSYEVGVCSSCVRTTPHPAPLPHPDRRLIDRVPIAVFLAGVLAAGVVGWASTPMSWGRPLVALGYVVVGGVLALGPLVWLDRAVSRFFPAPLPPSDARCPRCDRGRLYPPYLARRLDLPCPACGEAGYSFEAVGRS